MKQLVTLLLSFISLSSFGQACIKTITFTHVLPGNCLPNNESGDEDPAISIYCGSSSGTLIYAAEWSRNITNTNPVALPGTPWSNCNTNGTNSFSVTVQDPGTGFAAFVQTYEGDDGSCQDPMDGSDDCRSEGNFTFDLTPGSHDMNITGGNNDINFRYTVTETPIITSVAPGNMFCTSPNEYSAEVIVNYNTPTYRCDNTLELGNLVVNGQSFAATGSPQTITLTGLPADGSGVNVNAHFSNHSSCSFTQNNAFTGLTAGMCGTLNSSGEQACRKQITFTHVIPASCMIGADDDLDGTEDPAILIFCDNTRAERFYAAEWATNITSTASIPLPAPWGACTGFTNVLTLGPDVNPGTTSIPVFVETFEGDDSDCFDNGDSDDDCVTSGNTTLNLRAGIYTLDFGGSLALRYEVRNTPIVSAVSHNSNTCTSPTEFSAEVEVTYDVSQSLVCSMTNGSFGNLNVGGQSFARTSSPQTVTLTGLSSGTGNVALDIYIEGDHSSCVSSFPNAFAREDCSALLPIELAYFDAINQEQHVDLAWGTISERNAMKFIIKRSADMFSWTEIGQVEAVGNSIDLNEYHLKDLTPLSGISYYQLFEEDIDGVLTNHGVRSLNRVVSENTLFPNPAESQIHYVTDNTENIRIVDATGRVCVTAYQVEKNFITFDIEALNSGVYFVVSDTDQQKFIKK